jgi:hypothetical protein
LNPIEWLWAFIKDGIDKKRGEIMDKDDLWNETKKLF